MKKDIFLSSSISGFSLTIAIIVILCMSSAIAILFWLYTSNNRRLITLGTNDEKIRTEIETEFTKYSNKNPEGTFRTFIDTKKKSDKIYHIVSSAVYSVFIVILFIILIMCIVFRSSGQQIYFGNTTFMTIQSGSMSYKDPANKYYGELPNNQIKQYALVGMEKVKEEDLKQFDVIAFKHKGVVYVHRLVQISETDGERFYTTQGDANSGSLAFEINISYEQIVGRYSGYQSTSVGVFLTYLQSNVGFITLIFALGLLVAIDISSEFLSKSVKKRQEEIIENRLQGDLE